MACSIWSKVSQSISLRYWRTHFSNSYRLSGADTWARQQWNPFWCICSLSGKRLCNPSLQTWRCLPAKLGYTRIRTTPHIGNHASIRVLEKCGFISQGILKAHAVFPALGREAQDCMDMRLEDTDQRHFAHCSEWEGWRLKRAVTELVSRHRRQRLCWMIL